jgi:23S rRNA-/tRNA-specific pseudouridylate synthase
MTDAAAPPRLRTQNDERFEPPVARQAWCVAAPQQGLELLADAQARCGLDDARWQRLLWHRGLHVNHARLDPTALPDTVAAGTAVAAYWFLREPEPIQLDRGAILLDAEGVLALDKPSWLPTQPTRASCRYCLEAQARELCGTPWLWAGNRLDRGTSGVTLLCQNADSAKSLQAQLSSGAVYKRYLAVVSPPPKAPHFRVEGYLVRASHPRHAFFTFSPRADSGGRFSISDVSLIEIRGERALVEVLPRTGRTHQIRVHLAASGSPIVGDGLYAPPWQPSSPWDAGRLMLHAHTTRFAGPQSDSPLTVVAPMPRDWEW